jgi:hypothetical protein
MDKGVAFRGQTRPLKLSSFNTRSHNVYPRRTRGPISVVARTVRFYLVFQEAIIAHFATLQLTNIESLFPAVCA